MARFASILDSLYDEWEGTFDPALAYIQLDELNLLGELDDQLESQNSEAVCECTSAEEQALGIV